MPPLQWYVRRLGRMRPGELVWRTRDVAREAADRCRMAVGAYPGFTGTQDATGASWVSLNSAPVPAAPLMRPAWVAALRLRADRLLAHEFSFASLDRHPLGAAIDWNRDHENGRTAPLDFAPGIDYRDFEVTGDAKVVWELNRHHHLVVLARAYRATGDERYAREVCEQLLSWMDRCPPGRGMNWRSALELAIRAINWVWALDLITGSHAVDSAFRTRIHRALDVHVWDISRRYSRGSSANNHRIGEAAGVFVVASSIPGIAGGDRLRDESRAILAEEIVRQTYEDGCTREQALGYHFFAVQFFAAAAHVARRTGQSFPQSFWDRYRAMIAFARHLTAAGPPPLFGDADDGYVLDLGDSAADWKDALALAEAALPDAGDVRTEPAFWLSGTPSVDTPPPPAAPVVLTSREFGPSGYHLLQWGAPDEPDSVSVLFDCGELGFGTLAAHGHADALSFTLRAFGEDVLVDSGTFDYFTFPAWRDYFRTTRAHNTVVIDDMDQSVMLGPFMWGARASARRLDWQPAPGGGRVSGEHDGYARLAPPLIHRRALTLSKENRTLTIEDWLLGAGRHRASLYFHCAEHARVEADGAHGVTIDVERGRVRLDLDPRATITLHTGHDSPIGGWVSRRYHQKSRATTIRADLPRGVTEARSALTIGTPGMRT
jgi:hypothetical protein